MLFIDPLMDELKDAGRMAAYFGVLRNLIFFKQKPSTSYRSRGGVTIDEIVLHGTKSLGTQEQSANPLATQTEVDPLLHRPRPQVLAYIIVPEEYQAFHAGNPKHHTGVEDHNPRSIGIEMYQKEISLFKGDASTLDFTDWQYDTVAMLCYHISNTLSGALGPNSRWLSVAAGSPTKVRLDTAVVTAPDCRASAAWSSDSG